MRTVPTSTNQPIEPKNRTPGSANNASPRCPKQRWTHERANENKARKMKKRPQMRFERMMLCCERIRCRQRPKLSDPANGTRELQSERDGWVRWSAWLG